MKERETEITRDTLHPQQSLTEDILEDDTRVGCYFTPSSDCTRESLVSQLSVFVDGIGVFHDGIYLQTRCWGEPT